MIFSYKKHKGFTLVEMAIVLVILGFVLSALLLPLQAQRNQLFQTQTENTLEIAKKALLGYAQSQGRLPCPATASGVEVPLGGGACTQLVGFIPAATLGITPTDAQGFAIDAWNNRIRYAVTNVNTNAFTTSGQMNTVGITNLLPNLRVCNSSTVIAATTCSTVPPAEVNYSINNAVAVIYSTGITGSLASGGADENANLDNNAVFVSHDPSATGAANGEFDHLVTWISPFVLYNAMIEAGQLH